MRINDYPESMTALEISTVEESSSKAVRDLAEMVFSTAAGDYSSELAAKFELIVHRNRPADEHLATVFAVKVAAEMALLAASMMPSWRLGIVSGSHRLNRPGCLLGWGEQWAATGGALDIESEARHDVRAFEDLADRLAEKGGGDISEMTGDVLSAELARFYVEKSIGAHMEERGRALPGVLARMLDATIGKEEICEELRKAYPIDEDVEATLVHWTVESFLSASLAYTPSASRVFDRMIQRMRNERAESVADLFEGREGE